VVRFVVDTLGRVEPPSLDIVQSSHPLFLASVRTALDHLRFYRPGFPGDGCASEWSSGSSSTSRVNSVIPSAG
jgi:hypothetical protein